MSAIDDVARRHDLQELRAAAAAIAAMARLLAVGTDSERRVVAAIERTSQTMLLRLAALSPDLPDSTDIASPGA